ncbi:MAG: LysR family transcriptional regulator [Burkholderiales bacterium]
MALKWRADILTLSLMASAAQEGSISRAAARGNLALAAASRRIAEFEKNVGVKVFRRHARGISVTPAGALLIERLRLVLDDIIGLDDTIEDIRSGVTEHLSIRACDAAITQFLPRVLKEFVSAFPQVRVELEEMRSSEIVRAAGDRRQGLGVVWSDVETRGLITSDFREDELSLVVPTGHPFSRRKSVRFIETLVHEFVCLEDESPIYLLLRREAAKLGKAMRTRIQVRSFDTLCRMVEAGLGIGVVPLGVARSSARSLSLAALEIREPWTRRALRIVYREEADLSSVERRFLAFCRR